MKIILQLFFFFFFSLYCIILHFEKKIHKLHWKHCTCKIIFKTCKNRSIMMNNFEINVCI